MCGRYALYGPRKRTRADEPYFSHVDEFPGSWNVTPRHSMPIVRLYDGNVEPLAAPWNLLPSGKVKNNHASLIEALYQRDRAYLAAALQ